MKKTSALVNHTLEQIEDETAQQGKAVEEAKHTAGSSTEQIQEETAGQGKADEEV